MTTTADDLARTLAALDRDRPFALFLRHAEREEVPVDAPYADVDLTPAGTLAARALGRSIGETLTWAATSPFLRCRRTARELSGGHAITLEEDTRLGSHGPWMVDHEAGARLFASLGMKGVVHEQMAGTRWPCMRPLDEGTRLLLSSALDRIERGGSGVCVSHDAVLMPAIAWLTGDTFDGRWLSPLDGFALQRHPRGWLCLWRGSTFEVTPC